MAPNESDDKSIEAPGPAGKDGSTKVVFSNLESENHISTFANRIWGGWRQGNMLEINFMVERTSVPHKVTLEPDSEGKLSENPRKREGEKFVRENQATIFFPASELESLITWLQQKKEQLEQHQEE